MKDKIPGAWLSLKTNYYPAAVSDPLALLDDAYSLMQRAQGIVELTRQWLSFAQGSDTATLVQVLKAVETLMEMSAGSAEEAHVRFESIGDGWVTPPMSRKAGNDL